MEFHRRFPSFLCFSVITLVPLSLSAQNGSSFRDWTAAALPTSTPIAPRAACASLVSLTGYEFSIASATPVEASPDVPAYCHVLGVVQPEIRFEVNLPAMWNGRLYMFGNGGYAGEALDNPGRQQAARRALARGFATAQTNTGHDDGVEPLGAFASNPQKFVDYAFRAVHVTVVTAKRLIQTYYPEPVRHAYFDGCSTGGRQGLMSAQRFPDDFDGIVAGAPVLDFSGTIIAGAMYQRALNALTPPLGPEHVNLIVEKAIAKCDAMDGVKDGLIDDPRRCSFNPATDLPRCAADAPPCFTDAEIRALGTIYSPVTRRGAELYPGWPIGSEPGWAPWFMASRPGTQPLQSSFGQAFFKYLAFGRPNPNYDWNAFNLDADYDKLAATRAALDATDPDLSRFKARGGKMITYFGWADPALNPMMGVRYYENVRRKGGPTTADFYRLFMVPGMLHCAGGAGPSTFDALTAVVQWVEKGAAPQSIPAAHVSNGKPTFTRPLCPYPQTAVYNGTGNTDDMASFTCRSGA
jgi:tannase/feruloyl esterase